LTVFIEKVQVGPQCDPTDLSAHNPNFPYYFYLCGVENQLKSAVATSNHYQSLLMQVLCRPWIRIFCQIKEHPEPRSLSYEGEDVVQSW